MDEARQVSEKYEIELIPTVILFKQGKPAGKFIGLKSEESVKEFLDKELDSGETSNITEKKIEETIRYYQGYAEANGFRLNPDKTAVKRLVEGLLKNEEKYGAKYCPCRKVSGDLTQDRLKICPCLWHKGEIEKDGHCYCGLFYK